METNATQLSTIAVFCKAAELGSFTAAAQAMGLTPAAVSRSVGRLEDRLGITIDDDEVDVEMFESFGALVRFARDKALN